MRTGASAQEDAMLRDAVRAFLSRGVAPDGWRALAAEMGLGEATLDAAQAAIVMEEVGRARVTGPFADCLVAAWMLDRCGGDAAAVLATSIRSGDRSAVLAWAEPGMRYAMADIALTARRDGDGWSLEGTKSVVGWAPVCDLLLVAARTEGRKGENEGLSLFIVDQAGEGSPQMHRYRTIDGRPAADVVFEGFRLAASARIGPLGGVAPMLEEARDRATSLLAAESVGLLDTMLEQTIVYTGQRRQFGQPIAEFQALQHRMVDMYLECELARSSAWLAGEALDGDAAERGRLVSCAMANVIRAGRFVGEQAVQLHGGMGMTDELAIGHYVKRMMAIEVEWADCDWHLARIAGITR